MLSDGIPQPWRPSWARWRLRPPGAILTEHTGPVYAVAVGELDGRLYAVTAASDGRLAFGEISKELGTRELHSMEIADPIWSLAITRTVSSCRLDQWFGQHPSSRHDDARRVIAASSIAT
jgi:hypothetical protein